MDRKRFKNGKEAYEYLKGHGIRFGSQGTLNALTLTVPDGIGIKVWGAIDYLVGQVNRVIMIAVES